jgi:hypothetical protein
MLKNERIGIVLLLLAILMIAAALIGGGAQVSGAQPDRVTFVEMTVQHNGALYAVDIAADVPDDATGREKARNDALVQMAPGTTQAADYVLTGFKRSNIPVTVQYNPAGKAASATADETAVANGHLGWNHITPNFAYAYGGLTSDTSSLCFTGSNGLNGVKWGALSGSILAIACWGGADECDIVADNDGTSNWQSIDLQTVMLHEAGHCAGLGHSNDSSAVMYFAYNGVKREPRPDDVAGICAIYGCNVTPTATPTRTNTATPTVQPPTATPTNTPRPRPCRADKPFCIFAPNVAQDGLLIGN